MLWQPVHNLTAFTLSDRWLGDNGQPWIEVSDGETKTTHEDRLFG